MSKAWGKEAEVCDEFIQNAYQEYSLDTVAELLLLTGFLIDETVQYTGNFTKYVFLQGNKSEIYTKPEIDFIEKLDNVFVFKDYYKKTKKGLIPCRILVARIDTLDIISSGIAFNKIANKAMDGMNICLTIAEEGLLFTGRDFRQSNKCLVSEVIQTKEQFDEIVSESIYSSNYDRFVDYFTCILGSIQYKEMQQYYVDHLFKVLKVPYAYIEGLQDLEKILHLSFAKEIESTFYAYDYESFEQTREQTYSDRVKECEENLFTIESSRVNTMEMLFEAEEMERLAVEAESRNTELLHSYYSEQKETESIDEDIKALLNDPESMIKVLKKKRGL